MIFAAKCRFYVPPFIPLNDFTLTSDKGNLKFQAKHWQSQVLYITWAGSSMLITSSMMSSPASSALLSSRTTYSSVSLMRRFRHRRLATSIRSIQSTPVMAGRSSVYRYSCRARNVSLLIPGKGIWQKKGVPHKWKLNTADMYMCFLGSAILSWSPVLTNSDPD